MFVNINPVYGVNYKAGQIYCCYTIGHPVSLGISHFSYKDSDTPDFEKISHVGVCVNAQQGISAQPHGVDYEDLISIFDDPKRRIFFIEPKLLDLYGAEPLIRGMENHLGEKYDWKLIAGFGIVNSYISRWFFTENFKNRILNRFDNEHKKVCSEVVSKVLYEKGYCTKETCTKVPRELAECSCIKPWKRG